MIFFVKCMELCYTKEYGNDNKSNKNKSAGD